MICANGFIDQMQEETQFHAGHIDALEAAGLRRIAGWPPGAMPALVVAVSVTVAACGPAPTPVVVDVKAGKAAAGKVLYAKCVSCHPLGPGARSGFGPQLNGIVGRPAASLPDFRYSAALKNSGLVWTEQNLAAFVQSPGDLVPGTSMRFLGLRDGRQVADLLAYLKAEGGAAAALPTP